MSYTKKNVERSGNTEGIADAYEIAHAKATQELGDLMDTAKSKGYDRLVDVLVSFANEVENNRRKGLVRLEEKGYTIEGVFGVYHIPDRDLSDVISLDTVAAEAGKVSAAVKKQFGDTVKEWFIRIFEGEQVTLPVPQMIVEAKDPVVVDAVFKASLHLIGKMKEGAYLDGYGIFGRIVADIFDKNLSYGPEMRKRLKKELVSMQRGPMKAFIEDEKRMEKERKEKEKNGEEYDPYA